MSRLSRPAPRGPGLDWFPLFEEKFPLESGEIGFVENELEE